MAKTLIEVRDLKKYFSVSTGTLHAVDGVNLTINEGETLGVVGESGCGKSTLGRTILQLQKPTSGQVFFDGTEITGLSKKQFHSISRQMQIIFQDPYSSLPPRSTVGGILSEPVEVHNIVPKSQVKKYVLDLMEKCGLPMTPADLGISKQDTIDALAGARDIRDKYQTCNLIWDLGLMDEALAKLPC